MQLLRLGKASWDVLAVLGDDGTCEVLDFLGGKREEQAEIKKVWKREGQSEVRYSYLSYLKETVPRYGPQEQNRNLCCRMRPFEDGIWEFRKQPRFGAKLRVLFFQDENKIICVNAFLKTSETPQRKLKEAVDARLRYFSDKRAGKNRIINL